MSDSGTATSRVTRIETAGLTTLELTAKPKATERAAISSSSANASTTSAGVTPPNRNDRPPTGASITTYSPTYVNEARNFPRAMLAGDRPVKSSASQVRPLRSLAMVVAATAGPTQVTTANASEKKV